MAEYISGEKHREMKAQQHAGTTITLPKPLLLIVAAVILLGAGFLSGVSYQKSHQSKTATAVANGPSGFAGGRGRFGGQRPTIGSVTAVSASGITVQDSRTGSSTTLSITSSTQITENNQTVAVSDIQTGATVLVTASTSDKTQAARILVNPSFGGGGGTSVSGTSPSSAN